MPDIRKESRAKFLDKREKDKIDLFEKKLQDDKSIFEDFMLTDKEIKLRQIDEKILQIAKGNVVEDESTAGYQLPESLEDSGKGPTDKRMKALYGKYQDVGPTTTDAKLWEQSQDRKAKNAYRTIDEL